MTRILPLLLLVACAMPEDDDYFESVGQQVVGANGKNLNGPLLNGKNLNGVKLSGVTWSGGSLTGVTISGSAITGKTSSGATVTGAQVVGARLTGTLSTGETLSLKIDDAALLTGTNTDVWAYGVTYLSGSTWVPLCGAGVKALAVTGTWSYAQGVTGGGAYTADAARFTFGCRGFAIAKCVEMGYKPWKGRATHMAACTRLLRADYCGNGTPYTLDGTLINLYDNVGIQADTEAWNVEAEWTPSGARCISAQNELRIQQLNGTVPACVRALKQSTCGNKANFTTTSTLIMDEYQH